jgi:regulatory protein
MGGQITALKVQKRNRRRVSVYLDGRFAFGLAAIEATHLRVGQTLSDEEISRLKGRDAVERAAERALDLLSYRPRSQAEVRRRLAQKGYGEEAIAEALERLSRSGLLDDRAFATYWVANRFQFNPRGVVALWQELRQKGVDGIVIDQVLAEYDEEEAAARAAEAGARRLGGHDLAAFGRKLRDYLRRRGFTYALIEPLVEQALADHGAEDSLEE